MTGAKGPNNATDNVEVKTTAEAPQLLLQAQQQNQQMNYFIKPENNIAAGQQ